MNLQEPGPLATPLQSQHAQVLEEFQPPARSPTDLPDWMTSKPPIIRAQPLSGIYSSLHP